MRLQKTPPAGSDYAPSGFAGPKSFFEPSSSIIQNVFALIPIVSMPNEKRHNKIHTRAKKVGIELIAKRTGPLLKTTLPCLPLWPVSA